MSSTRAAGEAAGIRATQGRPLRREVAVVRNRRVADATWWLEVAAPEIAGRSDPGHFLMVGFGVEDTGAPFIPRPFSVGWRHEDGRVGLLVREFGAGTRRLARLDAGDRLLLLGPLGQGFRVDPGRPVACVAGGVGLAPFLFLVPECRRLGHEVRLLYGERSGDRVFDPELVEELTDGPVEVWTEDGTAGREGLVLEGLDAGSRRETQIMACGPTPMLRALALRALEGELDVQVSVEEHMGCGIGTCQGCVVPGADGRWIKSCLEGPVFEAGELSWERT